MAKSTLARGKYAKLRDRDYFHIMLNLDSYQDFLPTARALAERFLEAARERQADPDLEPELRPFDYTRDAFEARLDQIYQGLVDDVTGYEAQQSWKLQTREDVIAWMVQMAPFNQTDGAWLRGIAPVGPMDDVEALLFQIWIEELGAGDPRLNHPNMYTELLRSVGVDLPDLRTREYAENPDLLDSAFTLPLFQLAVSQFPQAYRPELLGMTQYLEWSSVELKNMVLLHRHYGLDPHFYEVHVAIDNAATGHGAKAKRAIELYLEQVRTDVGEDAMRAAWRRVWTGYVAFATTGTLGEDLRQAQLHAPTPASKLAAVIREIAPKARLNHGRRKLGGVLLNDLFAEPERLMDVLVETGRIVPGDPEASPFFALLDSDGPMYKIFTPEQIETWRSWVRSLGPVTAPVVVPVAAPDVRDLVDALRPRQDGAAGHAAVKLTGPDPEHPDRSVTQPVAWWFTQPTEAFLAALADPGNGWVKPGDAAGSPLVTDLVRGDSSMATALAGPAPGGGTWADVLTGWIDAGCPLPGATSGTSAVRPVTLLTPAERVDAHPTGKVHGSGSVH